MNALWTVGLLALALALLLTFGFIETHIAHPLVPLHIFRRHTLTGANLVTVAFAAAANTPIFFFALYMQQVRGFSPLVTGLAFLPTNLTMIAGAALGTRLVNWLGARRTIVAGMGTLLAALLLLARLTIDSNYVSTLLPGLVLLGGGLGLIQVATTVAGTQRISTTQRGLASGLLNVSVQMGTALGLALPVTVALC